MNKKKEKENSVEDLREIFPDYEPKRTPDTFNYYLRRPSIVYQVLEHIKEPNLIDLKTLIQLFNKYNIEAEKHPGSYEPGNIAIGADPDQYYPSDEEILVSELGKMVYGIIQMHSKEEIERIKVKDGIKSQIISFNEIKFRHVDVMGSGRFFYADKIDKEVKFEI